jgi:hypothetical protein
MTEPLLASISTVIITIVSLVIMWAIISVPVWISAKILTSGRARFGRAMLVTVIGPIVYALVLIISTSFVSPALGNRLSIIMLLGTVLAFLAWIYVFKKGFETGWIRAAAIAVLAIIVFVIIGAVIALFTHLFVPNAPPIITTQPFQPV